MLGLLTASTGQNMNGRCGPLYNNRLCDCDYNPSHLYCNEATGWCGRTSAHQNAQASTAYDCPPGPGHGPGGRWFLAAAWFEMNF